MRAGFKIRFKGSDMPEEIKQGEEAQMVVCPVKKCPSHRSSECPHLKPHPISHACEAACLYMDRCEPVASASIRDAYDVEGEGRRKNQVKIFPAKVE